LWVRSGAYFQNNAPEGALLWKAPTYPKLLQYLPLKNVLSYFAISFIFKKKSFIKLSPTVNIIQKNSINEEVNK
jgi:hypothetical protein